MRGERVIFVFLDGIGLGPDKSTNPFCQASTPYLTNLLGRTLTECSVIQEGDLLLKGIDACLGVEGIPQSATGQTSLFTGKNASKLLGYHLPAFPNKPLIDIIDTHSILKQVTEQGGRATFANAYTPRYFELVEQGKREHSATTLCVLAAKLGFRNLDDLRRGQAVYWDMTNEYLQHQDCSISTISANRAGQHLAFIGRHFDLVLYECFLPDLIGHRKDADDASKFVTRLDAFLQGVMENIDSRTSILVTSDHGNLEDLSTGAHTCRPVPLLVRGPFAQHCAQINSILDVTPAIVSFLAHEASCTSTQPLN